MTDKEPQAVLVPYARNMGLLTDPAAHFCPACIANAQEQGALLAGKLMHQDDADAWTNDLQGMVAAVVNHMHSKFGTVDPMRSNELMMALAYQLIHTFVDVGLESKHPYLRAAFAHEWFRGMLAGSIAATGYIAQRDDGLDITKEMSMANEFILDDGLPSQELLKAIMAPAKNALDAAAATKDDRAANAELQAAMQAQVEDLYELAKSVPAGPGRTRAMQRVADLVNKYGLTPPAMNDDANDPTVGVIEADTLDDAVTQMCAKLAEQGIMVTPAELKAQMGNGPGMHVLRIKRNDDGTSTLE